MLVGDPAYPLMSWLLKEFPGSVSETEESFNVHLGSARVAVEMAFGRLKGRWRMLMKRMDIAHIFAPQVIVACCALHNIVERNNDLFFTHWLEDVLQTEVIYQQPPPNVNRSRDTPIATDIRNHLKEYLAANFPLRRSTLRQH